MIAITRYVTWNLDERSSGAFSRALPDQTDMVAIYRVALKAKGGAPAAGDDSLAEQPSGPLSESRALTPLAEQRRTSDRDYQNLLQLVEEAVMSRDANRTTLVVGGLVQHIVSSWREHFCRSVTTKFNCFFMIPFVDEFHRFIRKELQRVYEGEGDDLTEVFDLAAARRSLELHRDELVGECMANKRLQEKFQVCSRMMKKSNEKSSAFEHPFTYSSEILDEDTR